MKNLRSLLKRILYSLVCFKKKNRNEISKRIINDNDIAGPAKIEKGSKEIKIKK